ncbi:hypothetical protein [Streptomyces barringtoniae]|uniref:hypothetical protein n=1 Tax=Streptomyces barringtoniae TaxID=2892029 RepID=UPI001E5F8DE2|nr:hypothetical protein [Streptomyces barringtoniae]MCC5477082.1 hypothetical protein [Streptomyces barringtoniae]
MPGTVLLLAASPVGRGRLVDAAGVLPVLAAVAPAVLSGTDTANVVELADPLEPQAVLTRLRAAAATPGSLTLYIAGQLQLDRRQRLPHLALARTTAATVRYTALPWHWIREELRLRSAADTALVVDLHGDAEAWQYVAERGLDCGANAAVYGRVAPGAGRRGMAEPAYMKAVATLLRSGHRPPLPRLHEQALARIAESSAGRDLVLAIPGGSAPRPPFAHPPIRLGRPEGRAPTAPGTEQTPHPAEQHPPVITQPAPPPTAGRAPYAAGQIPPAIGQAPSSPGTGQSPHAVKRPPQAVEQVPPGTRQLSHAAVQVPPPHGTRQPAHALNQPPHAAGQAPPPPGNGQRSHPVERDFPGAGLDPHAAISAAVQGGRHGEADVLAAQQEQLAVGAHGAASDEALHWAEVRADLAMFAGDAVRSCRAWLAVAGVRLAAGQAVDAPAVEAAVDRAHHQWGRITAPDDARELGPALAELRLRVPGRRQGALENVQRQLRQLQAAR